MVTVEFDETRRGKTMSPMSKPTAFPLHWLTAAMLVLLSACTFASPTPIVVTASRPNTDGVTPPPVRIETNTPGPTPTLSPTAHPRVAIRWLADNAAGWRPDETWLSEFHA